MHKEPKNVFLDANILIQQGKDLSSPMLQGLQHLAKAHVICVLTTEHTKAEVIKKFVENDYEVIKEVGRSHFRKIVKSVINIDIRDISKEEIKEKLRGNHAKTVEKMFREMNATTLSIDNVKPSTVLSAYAKKTGFFADNVKKDQFPDAFIFECLKKTSMEHGLIIVCHDKDFDGSAKQEKKITLVKSLAGLFQEIGLKIDPADVDAFLEDHHERIQALFDEEIKNWSLQASDVEDAEIEDPNISEIELLKVDSFAADKGGGDILVVGKAKVIASVSYTHPNWDEAMWDSEDKVLIPFEDVSGESEVETVIDFSMSIKTDENGKPKKIREIRFIDDNFIWVELHPYDPYL